MKRPPVRRALFAAPLLLTLGGCAGGRALFERAGWSTPYQPPATTAADDTVHDGAGSVGTESGTLSDDVLPPDDTPLLGWDGGVVDGAPPGVRQGDPRDGGIQPSTTGRMHIIELYQQVLDERDSLRDEVGALTAALERSQRMVAEVGAERNELQIRVAELEARSEAMLGENADLAARLTTAQIRRLEAEKLLLETRIDQLQTIEAGSMGASATENPRVAEAGS